MARLSLKDFLKMYTGISNKFIDEYYKFYELCEKNLFGIDSIKVIKYLNITSSKKFHENLREKYIINNDYVIKRLNNKLQKDKQDVFYYLSFDGFERICMMSRSKKGNQVRDYFILLRKFINYYREHIATKINSLTKNNKFVYILLVNKDKDIFKLGRSGNIKKRLQNYATGKDKHPDIKFIMIVNDAKQIESCAKIFTKKYQYKENKEIYKIDFDLLKSVIVECSEMHKRFKDYVKNNKKEYDTYIVFDDTKTVEYLDSNNNIIGYEKGTKVIKKSSKKTSKKTSKK
jgi:phage anti-repressor protein